MMRYYWKLIKELAQISESLEFILSGVSFKRSPVYGDALKTQKITLKRNSNSLISWLWEGVRHLTKAINLVFKSILTQIDENCQDHPGPVCHVCWTRMIVTTPNWEWVFCCDFCSQKDLKLFLRNPIYSGNIQFLIVLIETTKGDWGPLDALKKVPIPPFNTKNWWRQLIKNYAIYPPKSKIL